MADQVSANVFAASDLNVVVVGLQRRLVTFAHSAQLSPPVQWSLNWLLPASSWVEILLAFGCARELYY